jgi:hypothetical protein
MNISYLLLVLCSLLFFGQADRNRRIGWGAAIEAAAVIIVSVIYVIRTRDVEGRAFFNPVDSENLRSGCVAWQDIMLRTRI